MASTLFSRTLLGAGHNLINPSLSSILPQKTFPIVLNKRAFSSQLHSAYSTTYVGRVMASSGVGPKAGYSTSSIFTDEPVVSVDWLHSNLREADIKVLDASWYMPHEQRNPIQEYQVAHIPGALFFDLDGISDRKTNVSYHGLYVSRQVRFRCVHKGNNTCYVSLDLVHALLVSN